MKPRRSRHARSSILLCCLACLLAACAPGAAIGGPAAAPTQPPGSSLPAPGLPQLPTPFPSPASPWPPLTPPPPTPVLRALPGAPLPGPAAPRAITNVAVAADGTVWFSTGDDAFHRANGGLYRYANGQTVHMPAIPGPGPESGQEDNVQVLRAAPDGSVWAGAGCRVARYFDGAWHAVTSDCGDMRGDVTDFAFTSDGATWVAFVFKIARVGGDEVALEDRLMHSLAVAADGSLWAAGWRGLQDSHFVAQYRGRDWVTYPTVPLFGSGLGWLSADRDGRLWGTSAGGLVHLWPDGAGSLEWVRYEYLDGLPAQPSGRATLAPDGTVWAIAGGALAYFDGTAWHAAGRPGDETASALAIGPDGTLWAGTLEGRVWRLAYRRDDGH